MQGDLCGLSPDIGRVKTAMSKRIKLLLTSVGRRVELVQAFRDAAARLGIRLEIVGTDMSATAPALMYCDRSEVVPRIADPGYIPTLLAICQERQIDVLIPTIDTDLLLLAQERERFEALGTKVMIADPEKVALCRDKRFTADYFHSLGLASPDPVDDITKYNGGFPAFIKPLDGSSSIGADRADDAKQLAQYAAQLKNGYIIQPFVKGTEYTVDIFCDPEGDPVLITPRKRLAVRSGEVLKTQIDCREDIIEQMRTLVADFRPRGGITVQLIRDENGVNHYIEINPRFGGGAPLSIKAGADSAEMLLRCMMGEKMAFQSHAATDGAVFSRFDQSVCISHGKSASVSAVIFDLDDTLYPEKDYVRSGYRAVAALLPEVEDAEGQLWQAFEDGKPAIDHVLEQAGLQDRKAACLAAYRDHDPDIHLYPGAAELLAELRSRGVKLGIITDGRPEGQRAKLEALGLYDLVDSVLITDELGGSRFRKPNDIAFRIMQTRLNVPYEQMVYVGDNPAKDFHAPRTLGMQWIYFQNKDGLYSKDDIFCRPFVGSMEEIRQALG